MAGRPKQVYPNQLREARMAAMLTQTQLVSLTKHLAEQDPIRLKSVSISSIRALEAGGRRPRRNVAATLAKALDVDPRGLFPCGFDDVSHNPLGPKAKKSDIKD